MGLLSKEQLRQRANDTIKLIRAARTIEGRTQIDNVMIPLWREILTVSPHSVFDHPERHWEIETYVQAEIAKHGEYIVNHVLSKKQREAIFQSGLPLLASMEKLS